MPTSWNALHDGHVIERVDRPRRTGAAATSLSSKPIRVRDVKAAMRIPVKGDRFERWSGPVVYRPLALVLDRNVRDPEQWQPIGVADFDGDGHAEWVFSLSGYHEDGYLLVTNSLRHQVTTAWDLP